jgi:hypothetical protein
MMVLVFQAMGMAADGGRRGWIWWLTVVAPIVMISGHRRRWPAAAAAGDEVDSRGGSSSGENLGGDESRLTRSTLGQTRSGLDSEKGITVDVIEDSRVLNNCCTYEHIERPEYI